ncbi:MAG: hypothetical protein LBN39_13345, partial [Planctomycetaceae bacterium]|nr:hypothetical protein [Planctomycetaceae bacterium]
MTSSILCRFAILKVIPALVPDQIVSTQILSVYYLYLDKLQSLSKTNFQDELLLAYFSKQFQ